jgi:predicted amino acid dehydrogenase
MDSDCRPDTAKVVVITPEAREESRTIQVLGREVRINTVSCHGDHQRARDLVKEYDGEVDAIALDRLPLTLRLGRARVVHELGKPLAAAAGRTPLVDGSGICAGLERWGVILADRAEPGIFAEKRVLMVPGLNHVGLASSLMHHASEIRYADPVVFFGLSHFPGVARRATLEQSAAPILDTLRTDPYERLFPAAGSKSMGSHGRLFAWADVLAGDVAAIRRFAPQDLRHKTIVVDSIEEADLEDLAARGASIVVSMMPSMGEEGGLARLPAPVVEAVLVALRPSAGLPLTEDTYLDMIADLDWTPGVRYLQPQEAGVNRFAFVIHPLSVRMIKAHPRFGWARRIPDRLVEWVASYLPPLYVSRVTGAVSPATGQRVEGYLYTLGATPRRMMRQGVRSTYDKLLGIARRAQRRGARIMGLGAFTSVVGDAGKTVAHEADIAVTSGNSLTVAATLEAAKQAVLKMGARDLRTGRAMIVGATGSIGAVCARLIAQAIRDVVLISIEPERLIELKRRIQRETPGARVIIGTRATDHLPDCDLVVTSTSAFGQRVVDISQCKPGAVVCDVARPHDISPEEAAVRPDVLVIDSGEVLIPGDIDFGYDIGLPPGVAYACLAETCLLAMAGRFEDFTIGRELSMRRVKEIYHLFQEHGFRIAGLHSFDESVTDAQLVQKRRLAQELRCDTELLERTRAQAAARIADIPVAAKGVKATAHWQGLPAAGLRHVFGYLDRKLAPPL